MTRVEYRYALALTSQFYYCALPLRLDAYSGCQFKCPYCFARARGGHRGQRSLSSANVAALSRRFDRLAAGQPQSALDEFLANSQPIHFGGMGDPFGPIEKHRGVTLEILKLLASHRYPTVISTKSAMVVRDKYLDILKSGRFVVQMSMSSIDDKLTGRIGGGTSSSSDLLDALSILSNEGVPSVCRIQPLLPTREKDASDIVAACADAGVQHVVAEYLKLPVETSWPGTQKLSAALGVDLPSYFAKHSAQRVGREWVLPAEAKIDKILELRSVAHNVGMTFGAADNDLLLLNDGPCCCVTDNLFPRFGTPFRFTYPEAVRRGCANNTISRSCLDGLWCPERSIAMYVNSHSRRLAGRRGAGIRDYVLLNWNGSVNGFSPTSLYGVVDTGCVDEDGFRIYSITNEALSLVGRKR